MPVDLCEEKQKTGDVNEKDCFAPKRLQQFPSFPTLKFSISL